MLNVQYMASNDIVDFFDLSCSHCGHKFGTRKIYHRGSRINDIEDPTKDWNFCPICGSPLKEPAQ